MRWRDRWNQRLLARYVRKREAHNLAMRTPLDQLDPLTRELVSIGHQGFRYNQRVREIGESLHQRGGMAAMRAAHEAVSYWHPRQARNLELAWNGIGDWLG